MKLALAAALMIASALKPPQGLTVHEWGTFTSIAGSDGGALEWRPLAGPEDLPSFVYDMAHGYQGIRNGPSKASLVGQVRMETPVLYFYTDRETDVDVKVEFPSGSITEWYPRARMIGTMIDWGRIKIMPGATPKFLQEAAPSHYYPARETDASPVRVCSEHGDEYEKFLFYRGVGSFPLPIAASLDEDGEHVRLEKKSDAAIGTVILFENAHGKIGVRTIELGKEALLERPRTDGDLGSTLAILEKLLIARGLYEKEAKAMLATWKDSWFEEGLRAFYIVPRTETDRILPLTISPAPNELVRVLVGRTEILTPEHTRLIAHLAGDLVSRNHRARDAAEKKLARLGRFARPTLEHIRDTTSDHVLEKAIKDLLERS